MRSGLSMAGRKQGHDATAILLHGQQIGPDCWKDVEHCLPHGIRAWSLTRPGYYPSRSGPTGFVGNADYVLNKIDTLSLDRVIICAHSWAAGVAIELAARHPNRVAGLALVCPIGPGCVTIGDRILASRVGAPFCWGLMIAARTGSRILQLSCVARHLSPNGRATETAISEQLRRRSAWRTLRIEEVSLVDDLASVCTLAHQVKCRTEIVAADRDLIIRSTSVQRLSTSIAGSNIRWVVGAGHDLPMTHPKEVCSALSRLVASADPDVTVG
jgi:pimeloyl-ACP methyl ester carboxylesterase